MSRLDNERSLILSEVEGERWAPWVFRTSRVGPANLMEFSIILNEMLGPQDPNVWYLSFHDSGQGNSKTIQGLTIFVFCKGLADELRAYVGLDLKTMHRAAKTNQDAQKAIQ